MASRMTTELLDKANNQYKIKYPSKPLFKFVNFEWYFKEGCYYLLGTVSGNLDSRVVSLQQIGGSVVTLEQENILLYKYEEPDDVEDSSRTFTMTITNGVETETKSIVVQTKANIKYYSSSIYPLVFNESISSVQKAIRGKSLHISDLGNKFGIDQSMYSSIRGVKGVLKIALKTKDVGFGTSVNTLIKISGELKYKLLNTNTHSSITSQIVKIRGGIRKLLITNQIVPETSSNNIVNISLKSREIDYYPKFRILPYTNKALQVPSKTPNNLGIISRLDFTNGPADDNKEVFWHEYEDRYVAYQAPNYVGDQGVGLYSKVSLSNYGKSIGLRSYSNIFHKDNQEFTVKFRIMRYSAYNNSTSIYYDKFYPIFSKDSGLPSQIQSIGLSENRVAVILSYGHGAIEVPPILRSNQLLKHDTWYDVEVNYDGVSFRVKVDGVEGYSLPSSKGFNITEFTDKPYTIGVSMVNDGSFKYSHVNYFPGVISLFEITNRGFDSKSDNIIENLFNGVKGEVGFKDYSDNVWENIDSEITDEYSFKNSSMNCLKLNTKPLRTKPNFSSNNYGISFKFRITGEISQIDEKVLLKSETLELGYKENSMYLKINGTTHTTSILINKDYDFYLGSLNGVLKVFLNTIEVISVPSTLLDTSTWISLGDFDRIPKCYFKDFVLSSKVEYPEKKTNLFRIKPTGLYNENEDGFSITNKITVVRKTDNRVLPYGGTSTSELVTDSENVNYNDFRLDLDLTFISLVTVVLFSTKDVVITLTNNFEIIVEYLTNNVVTMKDVSPIKNTILSNNTEQFGISEYLKFSTIFKDNRIYIMVNEVLTCCLVNRLTGVTNTTISFLKSSKTSQIIVGQLEFFDSVDKTLIQSFQHNPLMDLKITNTLRDYGLSSKEEYIKTLLVEKDSKNTLTNTKDNVIQLDSRDSLTFNNQVFSFEIKVKPKNINNTTTILYSTSNNVMNSTTLYLTSDGYVVLMVNGNIVITSEFSVKKLQWNLIKIQYNLKNISIDIDGQITGKLLNNLIINFSTEFVRIGSASWNLNDSLDGYITSIILAEVLNFKREDNNLILDLNYGRDILKRDLNFSDNSNRNPLQNTRDTVRVNNRLGEVVYKDTDKGTTDIKTITPRYLTINEGEDFVVKIKGRQTNVTTTSCNYLSGSKGVLLSTPLKGAAVLFNNTITTSIAPDYIFKDDVVEWILARVDGNLYYVVDGVLLYKGYDTRSFDIQKVMYGRTLELHGFLVYKRNMDFNLIDKKFKLQQFNYRVGINTSIKFSLFNIEYDTIKIYINGVEEVGTFVTKYEDNIQYREFEIPYTEDVGSLILKLELTLDGNVTEIVEGINVIRDVEPFNPKINYDMYNENPIVVETSPTNLGISNSSFNEEPFFKMTGQSKMSFLTDNSRSGFKPFIFNMNVFQDSDGTQSAQVFLAHQLKTKFTVAIDSRTKVNLNLNSNITSVNEDFSFERMFEFVVEVTSDNIAKLFLNGLLVICHRVTQNRSNVSLSGDIPKVYIGNSQSNSLVNSFKGLISNISFFANTEYDVNKYISNPVDEYGKLLLNVNEGDSGHGFIKDVYSDDQWITNKCSVVKMVGEKREYGLRLNGVDSYIKSPITDKFKGEMQYLSIDLLIKVGQYLSGSTILDVMGDGKTFAGLRLVQSPLNPNHIILTVGFDSNEGEKKFEVNMTGPNKLNTSTSYIRVTWSPYFTEVQVNSTVVISSTVKNDKIFTLPKQFTIGSNHDGSSPFKGDVIQARYRGRLDGYSNRQDVVNIIEEMK